LKQDQNIVLRLLNLERSKVDAEFRTYKALFVARTRSAWLAARERDKATYAHYLESGKVRGRDLPQLHAWLLAGFVLIDAENAHKKALVEFGKAQRRHEL
jgi:hypothetical protein